MLVGLDLLEVSPAGRFDLMPSVAAKLILEALAVIARTRSNNDEEKPCMHVFFVVTNCEDGDIPANHACPSCPRLLPVFFHYVIA